MAAGVDLDRLTQGICDPGPALDRDGLGDLDARWVGEEPGLPVAGDALPEQEGALVRGLDAGPVEKSSDASVGNLIAPEWPT
jgi:hypothetical protein